MSRKLDGALTVQSGRNGSGRNVRAARPRGLERATLGILGRRRAAPAAVYSVTTCPSCGLRIRDLTAARLGFCDRCREFTGMCGAGRSVVCPDMMTRTTWHTPCTDLGVVAWEITIGHGQSKTVLCRAHDTQVRFGATPWILNAVPLGPASVRPPRKSAGAHTR
jgi:hypothetical protein